MRTRAKINMVVGPIVGVVLLASAWVLGSWTVLVAALLFLTLGFVGWVEHRRYGGSAS